MKKSTLIIAGILCVLVVTMSLMLNNLKELKAELKLSKSNISAMNDTLKTFKAKNGVLVAEKQSIYSSLKNLENINKNLYDTVKYYEKALKIKTGTVQIVSIDGGVVTHYDTVVINSTMDSASHLSLKAEKKDSVVSSEITANIDLKVKGDKVKVIKSDLNSTFTVDNLRLNIITGYKKNGFFKPSKQYLTAVTTNDNRFKVNKIDSWINKDFEKKRYLSLKPGIFAGGFYDPFYKHFSLGVGFGLTLQYIK